jgi:hypothetical protein
MTPPAGRYSMLFVEEEGTASSFQGVCDVIAARGLLSSYYSDLDCPTARQGR